MVYYQLVSVFYLHKKLVFSRLADVIDTFHRSHENQFFMQR